MTNKIICSYCNKEITSKQQYGQLSISGLYLHDKPNCYMKAFRGKSFRSIKFRLKNNIIGFKNKVIYFIVFHYYWWFK